MGPAAGRVRNALADLVWTAVLIAYQLVLFSKLECQVLVFSQLPFQQSMMNQCYFAKCPSYQGWVHKILVQDYHRFRHF